MSSFYEKYRGRIKGLRIFAEDILKIIAIVTAISFLDYFYSSADIQYGAKYLAHYYDRQVIIPNLIKYGLKSSAQSILELKPEYSIMMEPQYFDRNTPIDSLDNNFYNFNLESIDDFRNGLKYKPKEKVANFSLSMPGWVGNEGFWENDELYNMFDTLLDSLSFYKTMKIILAGREVVSMLNISNKGELPAKNIKIFLRAPYMLWPRSLITKARVEFLRIEPNYSEYEYLNTRTAATITIPFLKKDDSQYFFIYTSLHNITDWNIFVDYETDRKINTDRIFYIFLIVTLLYYVLPVLLAYLRKETITVSKKNTDEDQAK